MSIIDKGSSLRTIAFLGNYIPRRCGIATFMADLCEAVAHEAATAECFAVAMNDVAEGYRYPDRVRFEIAEKRLSEYRNAADFLNVNFADVVCLQHEYGIFGGPNGTHVLALLRELRVPLVTTFHTVLASPTDRQRSVLKEIARVSDRVIVMSQLGVEFLKDVYQIPPEKIAMIHHGIPDVPFVDPNYYKDQFGVEGRRVILTFGLLSPSKGIEQMIEALPQVVMKYPDAVYVILGATHPHIKEKHGEEYRLKLQLRVRQLGLLENVLFLNRFVGQEELSEFLGAADVYVTPYPNEAQITSGTLANALGAGNAIVSTPYWHAKELLAEKRGRLVPFNDRDALAAAVNEYFDNELERHATRKRAYLFGRQMIWKEVARRYIEVFTQVRKGRAKRPRLIFSAGASPIGRDEIPHLDPRHMKRLTDPTGIFQHAKFTVAWRDHGYCTDDNARALVVAAKGRHFLHGNAREMDNLAATYLAFLEYAFDRQTGRFRNMFAYNRSWVEGCDTDDCHGRALWGLGVAAAYSDEQGLMGMATRLFREALPACLDFTSPRAWAFALVGIHAYLRRFGGDTEVRRMREQLAERLYKPFKKHGTKSWPWSEQMLTYANGRLPQALLLSGQWLQRGEMVEMGLSALSFLLRIQKAPEGHFAPVGTDGWYPRKGTKARFDQQPIEAHAMIDACAEAWHVTQKERWLDEARTCFDWFLGRNDLGLPLVDNFTGGCRDGLHPDRANQNEGAESTLAWLMSVITMEGLRAEHTTGQMDAAAAPDAEQKKAPSTSKKPRSKSKHKR